MTTPQKSHATASHGRPQAKDALALLKADHEKVTALFEDFEEARGNARKMKLASEICQALTIHAQVEEELFYPEARNALKDKSMIAEAGVEHGTIKDLIAQIQDDEGGELMEARLKVLAEYVKHHIKEEQGEIFKQLKETDLDLQKLGERLAERMEELQEGSRSPRDAARPESGTESETESEPESESDTESASASEKRPRHH